MALTAYLIDPEFSGLVFEGTPVGPYRHGADLYIAAAFASSSYYSVIWKSSDGGETWAPQDETNAPLISMCVAYYPGAGDIIYFGYTLGSGSSQRTYIRTFDIHTRH